VQPLTKGREKLKRLPVMVREAIDILQKTGDVFK